MRTSNVSVRVLLHGGGARASQQAACKATSQAAVTLLLLPVVISSLPDAQVSVCSSLRLLGSMPPAPCHSTAGQ